MEWISLKDRLPEEGDGRVLVYTPYYFGSLGMAFSISDWWIVQATDSASHWMPLPAPPREDD